MKHLLVLLVLVLTSLPLGAADGGSVTGNGGDVIVCDGKKPILLDVYEMNLFENRVPNLGGASLSADQKVRFVLDKVSKVAPGTAEIWHGYYQKISASLTWTTSALVDIPDSQHTVLPTGCRLEQVAVQERIDEKIVVTIQRQLWDAMDEDNRAALLLHEVLYADALNLDETNSVHARQVNQLLLDFTKNQDEFREALKNRGFPFEFGLIGGEVIFYNKGYYGNAPNSDKNQIVKDACGFFSKTGVKIDCRDSLNRIDIRIENGSIKAFYDNLVLNGYSIGLPFKVRGADLIDGIVYPSQEVTLDFLGYKFVCGRYSEVRFYAQDIVSPGHFRVEQSRLKSCDDLSMYQADLGNQPMRLSGLDLRGAWKLAEFYWDFDSGKARAYGFKVSMKDERNYRFNKSIPGGPNLEFFSVSENYDEKSVTFGAIQNRDPLSVYVDGRSCSVKDRLKYFVEGELWKFAGAEFHQSCRVSVGTQGYTVRKIMLSSSSSFSEIDLVNEAYLPIGDRSQGAWFIGPLFISRKQSVLSGTLAQAAELNIRFEGKTLLRVVPKGFSIKVLEDGVHVPEDENREHLFSENRSSGFYEAKFNTNPKASETMRFPLASGESVLVYDEVLLDKDLSLIGGIAAESFVLPVCQKNSADLSDVSVVNQRIQAKIAFFHGKALKQPHQLDCFWIAPIER